MEDSNSPEKPLNFRVNFASREEIEAHEIFFDAKKIKKDSPILETEGGRFELPIKSGVFLILFLFASASLFALFSQTAYFQIFKQDQFKNRALANKTRIYPMEAKRGIIYDNNFLQLAENVPSFDLIADPQQLPHSQRELAEITDKLSAVLKISRGEIEKLFEENIFNSEPFLAAQNIDHDTILFFETNNLPGISLKKNSVREYPFSEYLSHILGYTGKINRDELERSKDYFFTDIIGKEGIESSYEKELRGKFGKTLVERDASGKNIDEKIGLPPEDGKNLQLFLDFDLQEKLYDALNGKLKELGLKKAAAVALDPNTGGILAMISFPNFDNNLFSRGISKKDFEKLTRNNAKPLFNRAISGVYPSGSTIKPLLASAALQENIITPKKMIFAPESIQVGNWTFSDWKFHGLINLYQAIAESSNVYFYTVGGGYGDIKGLGIDFIKKYLSAFGWGKVLGVDLPGEAQGTLPDPEFKKKNTGEDWFIGDTYNSSIGQGYVGVTPLQLAAATTAVANGGAVFKPKIVQNVVDSEKQALEEFKPEILNQNFIDPQNLAEVRRGMREGVIYGSSRALGDLAVKVAGKTGTAQFGNEGKTHAWWTGFAPYDNPQIVLTILVEEGGESSFASVPVAREVLDWYFRQ